MPSKTPAKKAPAAKKPAAKRPSAEPKRAKSEVKPVSAPPAVKVDDAPLRAEIAQLQAAAKTRDQMIAQLEKQVADARKPDPQLGGLQAQVRDLQAKLVLRQAELEGARAELGSQKDLVDRLRGPGEAGNLRCPRCGGHMTEYQQDPIKADRCDSCHGIYFDNGELEAVLLHHDEQQAAGKKGWFSSLLGKR